MGKWKLSLSKSMVLPAAWALESVPVLSCGLACQFQNKDNDKNAHVAVDDLQPYIDDALDLIEFANGATTTKWGKLRAEMGKTLQQKNCINI